MKTGFRHFIVSGLIMAHLLIRFVKWLREDLFRAYTLITVLASAALLPIDFTASIVIGGTWMIMVIVLRVKKRWQQIVLIDALLTSLFAGAAFRGGIGIHNPLTATIATTIFFIAGLYLAHEIFNMCDVASALAIAENDPASRSGE